MSEEDSSLKVPIIGFHQPDRNSKYVEYTTKTIPDAKFHFPKEFSEDPSEESVLSRFIKLSLPADIELAKLHGRCKRVYNLKYPKNKEPFKAEKCPCCGFETGEKFSIMDKPDIFSQLGGSYPLFFYTGRYLGCSLFFTFLLVGIACSATLTSSSSPYILVDKHDGKEIETSGFVNNSSFSQPCQTIEENQNVIFNITGNNIQENLYTDKRERNLGIIDSSDDIFSFSSKNNPSIPKWHPILHCVALILLMISFIGFYCFIFNKASEYDNELITCSDFSLFIVGLHKEYKKTELRDFIIKSLKDYGHEAEIVSITCGYKFQQFNEASQSVAKWLFNLNFVKAYKEANNGKLPTKRVFFFWKKNYKDEDQCYEKAEKYRNLLKIHSKELKNKNVSSCAFVTFRTTTQEKAAERLWRLSMIRRNIYIISPCKIAPNHFYFNGSDPKNKTFLLVRRAPEPKDIYWENLGKFTWKKIFSKGTAFFFSVVILGVCFSVIVICTAIQNKSSSSGFTIKNFLLGNFISFTLTIANKVAPIGFRYCSKFEKYLTWSFFGISMLVKLLIFFICANIILPAIVHKSMKFDEFATSIYSVIYSTTVVGPVIDYINVLGRIKKIRQQRLNVNEKTISMSQFEANEIFEGDEVELSESFASIIKSFGLCLFFAPVVPMGLIIGSFGMFLEVYIFKLSLIKDKAMPRFDSENLAIAALHVIPWCFILYAVGIILFYSSLYEDLYVLYVVMLIISICFTLICYTGIIHRTFNLLDKNDPKCDYFDYYKNFTTDYDRENPITEKQGRMKWENFENTPEGIQNFCQITEDVIEAKDAQENFLGFAGNRNYKNNLQNANDSAAYMTRRISVPKLVIN
ncbi:hypothetical protein SteCoe_32946 [Stentor coeruleus]|uniref:CSC1/OSCA1-like cytosolic domain-containing protein n=1 Tax=Stentor coeruleus TaxID=5963 RepID=A0A1R2AXW1_9CILI|nr:hypothetical protein SteCoe_32946 [Stentor coeruleus]